MLVFRCLCFCYIERHVLRAVARTFLRRTNFNIIINFRTSCRKLHAISTAAPNPLFPLFPHLPDLREATKGAKYRNTFGGRHKLWPRPQVIKYQAACSRQMEMERGPWCLVFGFSGFGFGLWPLALSNFA